MSISLSTNEPGLVVAHYSKSSAGHFEISRTGGHVHFYWIKSGTLFRYGAVAYLGVSLINGLYNKENKITGGEIVYSAGVLGFGLLLKYLYKTLSENR